MKNYLLHFMVSVVLLTGAIAGFNWWVDPYAIYHERDLRPQPPLLIMNERVFKTVKLARTAADIVILGTSRTDIGIGRAQQAFHGKRVVNLATFGQPLRESRRLMEIALEHAKPETIMMGLDFFAFNALFVPPADLVEENYSPLRRYSLMLSVSSLADAWKVMRRKAPGDGECCYADGFRTPQNLSRLAGSYRKSFTNSERNYLLEKYLPYPECRFTFASHRIGSSLEDLRAIVRLAHNHQINLLLFISPAHARQWETLAAAGLWSQWEAWKRELVNIIDAESQQAGVRPFLLWDFSNYDSVSGEGLPRSGDNEHLMRWYSDSAHYTPELGKRIVGRVFSTVNQDDNWGLPLNKSNLEGHLEQIRQAREHYRATHDQDIAEIENSAREIERIKHCLGNR